MSLSPLCADEAWLADDDQIQEEGLSVNNATDPSMEQDPDSAYSAQSGDDTKNDAGAGDDGEED